MKIAWKHPAEDLLQLYKREQDGPLAKRCQVLWLLREGRWLIEVKRVIGLATRPFSSGFGGMRVVGGAGIKRIYRPPYPPEINPGEGLRQRVEGKVWVRIMVISHKEGGEVIPGGGGQTPGSKISRL